MKRLLIIHDENLRTSLDKAFQGDHRLDLQLVDSPEQALESARQSPPELVIFGHQSPGMSPGDFSEKLKDGSNSSVPILCVSDGRGTLAERAEDSPGVRWCAEHRMVPTAARLLGIPPPTPEWVSAHLLAALEPLDPSLERQRRSYANILELGENHLLLETSDNFEVGDSFNASFVLAGDQVGSFSRISIRCTMTAVRNAAQLHFEAKVQDISAEDKAHLRDYLIRHVEK